MTLLYIIEAILGPETTKRITKSHDIALDAQRLQHAITKAKSEHEDKIKALEADLTKLQNSCEHIFKPDNQACFLCGAQA